LFPRLLNGKKWRERREFEREREGERERRKIE